jgi:lincosamide nucleotidyltransferase A/C/D/E
MRADDVLEVLDAVAVAGVDVWLVGGWGVDALLGEETRVHDDVDLSYAYTPERRAKVRDALAALGFAVREESGAGGIWLPIRSVLRDRRGRSIELLPANVGPGGTDAPLVVDPSWAVVTGRVGDRTVPCASPKLQLMYHSGYLPRDADRVDVARLVERFDLLPPKEYRA